MKIQKTYICEICNSGYKTKDGALSCEGKGRPDLTIYKKGCLGGDQTVGSFSSMCVFILAKTYSYSGHDINISAWGYRDNIAGDDAIESDELCRANKFFSNHTAKINFNKPCTQRAIRDLIKNGITPTVWDGEKCIEINQKTINKCLKTKEKK